MLKIYYQNHFIMASNKLVIVLLNILFTTMTLAQKSPMKWGKISTEDLSMESYALDPDAEAVMLGDYGTIEFFYDNAEIKYEFTYHQRVKILKESAFGRGDIEIGYYGGQNSEKVSVIKAQVFYPDGSKVKMSKKNIFDEKVSENQRVKKFAIPNLKEGCIFEYQYTKSSEYFISLENWYFQSDIPVRHSELWVDIPSFFSYVYLLESAGKQIESNEFISGGNSRRLGATLAHRMTFKMTDLEAMKEEPYITTMNNYRAGVRFQLKEYKTGRLSEKYLSTWDKLAEYFLEHDKFGKRYSKARKFAELLNSATPYLKPEGSTLEKIKATQAFIAREVKWDERYGVYASTGLDGIFAKKIASSGELNMMLLALLKHQSIDAKPLLISTRGRGEAIQLYPIRQQFNHMMVYVMIDGKPMILDALDKYHPAGYPHVNSLNIHGWLIEKDNSRWIDIKAPTYSESYLATFELNDQGNLAGVINASLNGYRAINARKEFNESPEFGNWKKGLSEIYPDVKIDSIEKINLEDIYQPFKLNIGCSIPQAAQVNGDFIYLNPMVFPSFDENPFKLENRNYPVEIPYPIKENYVLNLTIPDGYMIEELPEQVKLTLPKKGGKFQYFVKTIDASRVQLISKVSINQLYFTPAEYSVIKKLIDLIVEKQGEQIVLKKKS